MSKRFQTLFCGTPEIALPSLRFLSMNPHVELTGVITPPDRPAGRGHKLQSPALAAEAKELGLKLFQTENINKDSDILSFLENNTPDLIIVFAFSHFLSNKILQAPHIGCFNIHTSLLPKYRGAAPIQYAILNGDKKTGITIQKMVKKMDAGDIAQQREIDLSPTETAKTLHDKLAQESVKTLEHFLQALAQNQVEYKEQDENSVSFAPILTKELGKLDFLASDAETLERKVRALTPWPSAYCFLNTKRCKVLESEFSPKKLAPGEIDTSQNELLIGCLSGTLRLKQIQIEGKKASSDEDWIRGMRDKITLG